MTAIHGSSGWAPGRVSVVVPAARIDNYLFEALTSLRDQDHHDLEVVLVLDGASPPDDFSTIANLTSTVVALPRRLGTPYALNVGLAVATGSLVARLDADDIALPGRISSQAAQMRQDDSLVALGSRCELIDAEGRSLGPTESVEGPVDRALLRSNPLVHSSMMFRADALQIVGGYNPKCTRMQDYELYLRLARVGSIGFSGDVLTKYRVHPTQSSRRSPVLSHSTVAITRERLRLAESLGESRFRAAGLAAAWVGWQVLRQAGIVRPRLHRSTR